MGIDIRHVIEKVSHGYPRLNAEYIGMHYFAYFYAGGLVELDDFMQALVG